MLGHRKNTLSSNKSVVASGFIRNRDVQPMEVRQESIKSSKERNVNLKSLRRDYE